MVHDDTTAHLAGGLPEFFPSADNTDNYRLLEAVGEEADALVGNIQEVDSASTVQDADTLDELLKLGLLIDTAPLEESSVERYRARLLSEYSTVTGKGTISDVIETAARMLDVAPRRVGYSEPPDSGTGVITLTVPGEAVDDSDLTEADITDILDSVIAGSYRLEATRQGTFTYITPTDYDNDLHDVDLGYDGLDANGDPKDNGGTYAGLLN